MSTNWPLEDMLTTLNQLEAQEHELVAAAILADKAVGEKQGQIKAVKAQIKALLQDAGVVSERVAGARVTLAKGPARLIIDDDELIPDEFFTVQPVREDARIKARLMSGMIVPGAHLQSDDVLRIKWEKL